MDKNTLIALLLAAVILVSVLQTYQIITFQSTIATLKSITGAVAAQAPARAAPATGGVGGC